MAFLVLTRRNVATLKSILTKAFPDIRSGHVDEALAAAIGFRTHAALLAALKAQGNARVTVLLNEQLAAKRIEELTGREVSSEEIPALWWVELPDMPEGWAGLGAWWRHVANEN